MLLSKCVPLCEAQPGDVCEFSYGRNKSVGPVRRVGKVSSVRDTFKNPISYDSEQNNKIDRSRFLLTVVENGGKIRCFYGEAVAGFARRLTLLGRAVKWICGYRFAVA